MPTLTEDENMPIKAKKALCALISALLVAGCIPLSPFAYEEFVNGAITERSR